MDFKLKNVTLMVFTDIDGTPNSTFGILVVPFGKVTIATALNATIQPTAAGVSGYTGDTATFSPILASTFETIFDQNLQIQILPKYHTLVQGGYTPLF